MTPILVLTAFLVLQVKHLLADFVLQSGWIVRTKGIYGHPGGIVHAGLHAVLSIAALVITPIGWAWIAAICVAEFVVHYHIDWLKDRLLKRSGAKPTQWYFWVLTGADQFAHHLTYIAMLYTVLLLA